MEKKYTEHGADRAGRLSHPSQRGIALHGLRDLSNPSGGHRNRSETARKTRSAFPLPFRSGTVWDRVALEFCIFITLVKDYSIGLGYRSFMIIRFSNRCFFRRKHFSPIIQASESLQAACVACQVVLDEERSSNKSDICAFGAKTFFELSAELHELPAFLTRWLLYFALTVFKSRCLSADYRHQISHEY